MLLTEVCHDVLIEPVLHPLSGEELQHAIARAEDEARVDIVARNFWGNRQVAFFHVKILPLHQVELKVFFGLMLHPS